MSGRLKKVLIIDDVHETLIRGLKDRGVEVDYRPGATRENLLTEIRNCEGLVVRTKTLIDREVLSDAERLQFIARAGSGLDNIDTDYCETKGIFYFNAGEANADAVGEQAVGTLLALLANIVKADREVRSGKWDREGNRGTELKGKTAGIVGYGNTGKAFARKLAGFGVNVLAYDKYLQHYSDEFATASSMTKIFNEADIISFHIPLTAETAGMVNKAYVEQFRKPFFLLNLSRGKIVNTKDLIDALETGKVKGAGLDVLENEKIDALNAMEKEAFEYLVSSPRTVLTPHIGGWTSESYEKISKVLLDKIVARYF